MDLLLALDCLDTDLKWDDDDEDLLVPVRQDVFDEGPARANQHDSDEQKGTLHTENNQRVVLRKS